MTPYANFDLSAIESCSEIPACRGPEVLAILVGIDPISAKESEEYPHNYPKDNPERVEKFATLYRGYDYNCFFVDGFHPKNPQTKYHRYSVDRSRFRGLASSQ
jgi:hypothetical protein